MTRQKMNVLIRLGTFAKPEQKLFNRCFFALTIVLIYLCDKCSFHEERLGNYLLCKYCGADAADLEYAVGIQSPVSLKTENQTLSGRLVLLQTLKNPADVYFDVITVKKSNCIGIGEWKKAYTWFPGFAWKACVCRPWGHFLGWVFEPYDSLQPNQKKASERGFYALISDNILTEQFSNSLLVVPKIFKS